MDLKVSFLTDLVQPKHQCIFTNMSIEQYLNELFVSYIQTTANRVIRPTLEWIWNLFVKKTFLRYEWSTFNSAQLNLTLYLFFPKNYISSRMDVILDVSPVLSLGWRVWTDHKENVEANGWQNDITCCVPTCLKLWNDVVQTEKYRVILPLKPDLSGTICSHDFAVSLCPCLRRKINCPLRKSYSHISWFN